MIAFSGIDCGGKSTQIEILSKYLTEKQIKHRVIWSRGGYTPCLEALKNIVRRDKGVDVHGQDSNEYRQQIHGNPKKRKLLLWLSIFDLALYYGIYFRLIEFMGIMIIADRYFWDSYIDFKLKYQELPFETWRVWAFAKWIYKKPEHSVIYTIPAEVSMYRSTLKDEPWPETKEERMKRIDCYHNAIEKKRWQIVIDATKSIDKVAEETKRALEL